VTNALRHARAQQITVQVRLTDRLVISIRDDGQGFSPDATLERVAAGGHLGLIGIRERTRALGGVFHLTSAPGAGTDVRVELPGGAAT
jgi:two-component system NarL family sensor kinase